MRAPVLEKYPNEPAVPSPFYLRGNLTPLARTFVSTRESILFLSRPSLNVFGAASPLFRRARISPNHNDQPAQACTAFVVCGWGWRKGGKVKLEVIERPGGWM